MRKDLNEIIRDWFTHDDFFWSNTTNPILARFNENNFLPKNRVENTDYRSNIPATNIYEDEWSYRYELTTPGFTKKELNIELENNTITISGERKDTNKKDSGDYISKEYHSTKFYRSFNLPENVVGDEVHAKVENGITTLFLPKEKPTKNKKLTKKIEIS